MHALTFDEFTELSPIDLVATWLTYQREVVDWMNERSDIITLKHGPPSAATLSTMSRHVLQHQKKIDAIKADLQRKIREQFKVHPVCNPRLVSHIHYAQIEKLIKHKMINHETGEAYVPESSDSEHITIDGHFCKCMSNDKKTLGLQFTTDVHRIGTRYRKESFNFVVEWKPFMFKFSLYDWALMIILFMVKTRTIHAIGKANNRSKWTITQKISRTTTDRYTEKFQLAFDSVITCSRRWSTLFAGKEIIFDDDTSDIDLAMQFDTIEWTSEWLRTHCGVILEDWSDTPSYSYYWGETSVLVRDHTGKVHETLWQYLKFRVKSSLRKMEKCEISRKVLIRYHLRAIRLKLKVNVNKCRDLTKGRRKRAFEIYHYEKLLKQVIVPLRLKRLQLFLKTESANRDSCAVCGREECYSVQEATSSDRVHHLFRCPCGDLLVCCKKCQKYAWTVLDHRSVCSNKR